MSHQVLLVCSIITLANAAYIDKTTLSNETSKINTTLGIIVRGSQTDVKVNSTKNVTIDLYYGIPFAEPPLGKLRFQPPQPKSAWNSSQVLVADEFPASCIQENVSITGSLKKISEDCLYLNMYVPTGVKKGDKVAVMLFIHGGGFQTGAAEQFPGEYLAAHENIIVVIIQYRVGILGFLSTDNKVMKGNYGLWDQQLALKWVKENVANFGGDANLITIFGESAGGSSVSLQLLNEQSKKYFKRGIVQSGSAFAAWTVLKDTDYARKFALKFAKEKLSCTKCKESDYKCILECLQQANVTELLKQQSSVASLTLDHVLTIPLVDGEFLTSFPLDMPASKFGDNETELMIGVAENEGAMFLYFTQFFFKLNYTSPVIADCQNFIRTILTNWPQLPAVASKSILEAAVLHATPWSDPTNYLETAKMTGKLVGRYYFVSPANLLADRYVKNKAKVYYYVFDHTATLNFAGIKYPSWVGSSHGDDLLFTNGLIFRFPSNKFKPIELEVARRSMRLWANFARSGNPSSTQDPWKKMTSSKKEYLRISTNSSKQMTGGFERQECAFLEKILPVIAAAATSRLSSTTEAPEKPEKTTPAMTPCVSNTRGWIIAVAVIGSVAVILFFALLGTCVNCQRQNGRGSAYIT